MSATPRLGGVIVHWGEADTLSRLLEAWPFEDPRLELVVVDNQPTAETEALRRRFPHARWRLEPGNPGFAAGVNRGVEELEAPSALLLNPDVVPEPGALEALLEGEARFPEAAGLVPRLIGFEGDEQSAWQLGSISSRGRLWGQCCFLPAPRGPARPPEAGTAIEQPAAACLLLRRSWLDRVGGMDEGFRPAWFEDVDLARRLRDVGGRFVYWPPATFRHGLGRSVPQLGYGPFLWIYYRSLVRYVGKHHGRASSLLCRPLLLLAGLVRLPLVLLRRPGRARSRREAIGGLLSLMAGAASGWRRPRTLAERWPR